MLEIIKPILAQACELKPDLPILVGVSGGPDSLCLLDLLHRVGYPLVVGHFNHKLRPEADDEARMVAELAASLRLPFVSEADDIRGCAEAESLTIEAAARLLRYRFLFAQARQYQAQAVAVGHTADDQVETVLMHLIRGAGLVGLKGMGYRGFLPEFDEAIPLVRPLLDVWRQETLDYCTTHGLKPNFDSSNDSLDFLRNRLRHQLIPSLEAYNPRFRQALWRTAYSLAGDYAILSEVLDSDWAECVRREGGGFVAFRAAVLSEFSPAVQRNLFRRALHQVRPGLADLNFKALERATSFLSDTQVLQVDLIEGTRLFREADQIYLAAWEADLPLGGWPQFPAESDSMAIALPGELELPNGWRLSARRLEIADLEWEQILQNADPFQAWLDVDDSDESLSVRPRRWGDRFQPLGMKGHAIKLSDFFVNVKLPRRARAKWPLVCVGETIAWVPGYRLAHPYRLTKTVRGVVYLSLKHAPT
jgi:tRNA(Ile)-lysidine synthase